MIIDTNLDKLINDLENNNINNGNQHDLTQWYYLEQNLTVTYTESVPWEGANIGIFNTELGRIQMDFLHCYGSVREGKK